MIQPLGTNYHGWLRWWWLRLFSDGVTLYYHITAVVQKFLNMGAIKKHQENWSVVALERKIHGDVLFFFFKVGLLLGDWIAFCCSHVLLPAPVLVLLLQSKLGGEPTILCISFWFNCSLLSLTMQHGKFQLVLWQPRVSSLGFLSRATTPPSHCRAESCSVASSIGSLIIRRLYYAS